MFYKSYTLKLSQSKLALSKQLPDYRYADKKLQQNYLLHFVCPYTSYVDDRYCALSSIQSPLLFSQYPVSYSIILVCTYIFKYSQLSISMQQSCRSMGKYWRNIGQEAVIVNLKILVFATTAANEAKYNIERWLNMRSMHIRNTFKQRVYGLQRGVDGRAAILRSFRTFICYVLYTP